MSSPGGEPKSAGVELALPFRDRWLVQNSPARRVPSHGTNMLGTRYAIDFVGVDQRGRTARVRDWRTLVATEPPERYVGFGREILAPAGGVVAGVHDGELDHRGRRSQLTLVPYLLGQGARLRQGPAGLAGNHLILELGQRGLYVLLAHLRAGSFRVAVGDVVQTGQVIAECGNSGNSTEPHVHLQVMDGPDATVARGVPMTFRNFREWPRGSGQSQLRAVGMPGERSIIEAGDAPWVG